MLRNKETKQNKKNRRSIYSTITTTTKSLKTFSSQIFVLVVSFEQQIYIHKKIIKDKKSFFNFLSQRYFFSTCLLFSFFFPFFLFRRINKQQKIINIILKIDGKRDICIYYIIYKSGLGWSFMCVCVCWN